MERAYSEKSVTGLLLVAFGILVICLLEAFAQPATDIIFSDKPMKMDGAKFYVAEVKDNRADKQAIASLIPSPLKTNSKTGAAQTVNLKGGSLNAIETYLKTNLPLQNGFYPVSVKFNKLMITETALPDKQVDGKLDIAVSFELMTGEDMYIRLVNYKSDTHYIRYTIQPGVPELTIHQAVENAMVYFNNWVNQQVDINPLFAKKVKLVFDDYHDDKPEADTIYYANNRPLTWADFKGRPRNSHYNAEVMPGLGFTEKTSINKGVIKVAIATKVYIPKSAAWVSPGRMDDYALNHEQRHFEITKIISERFKKKLLDQKLPVLNYDGTINVEYFDALRDLNRMQKQYDDETGHGVNASAQQRWNEFIDKELAGFKN